MERAHRLSKGAGFDTAFREGAVHSGPLLVVRVRARGEGPARWGFAVGKKMAPHSVDRNRLRRQLREAARGLAVAHGYDIIVVTRPAARGKSFWALQEALRGQLRRANLLAAVETDLPGGGSPE